MAEAQHFADSLRVYLTGAASDGAAQADPDLSLGYYRSSTEVQPLGILLLNAITGIHVDLVSGANGTGDGTLHAPTVDTLIWTAPGGTSSAAVAIANGETKILEDAANPSKFVRVTRNSATDLAGTCTVRVAPFFNNVAGLDNVSSAEAAAGDDEVRCVCLYNESDDAVSSIYACLETLGTQAVTDGGQLGASGSGTITTTGSFADWPSSGWAWIRETGGASREVVYYSSRTDTVLTVPTAGRGRLGTSAAAGAATDTADSIPGIRLAEETGSYATDKRSAGEGSVPAGLTWSFGITSATGVTVSNLAVGAKTFLWIRREVVVGELAHASLTNGIVLGFTV